MLQATTSARRRKLLSEIERLARVAVFGALSEPTARVDSRAAIATRADPSMVRTSISAIAERRGRPRATTCRKGRRKRRGEE
jgi:hypothetical protein